MEEDERFEFIVEELPDGTYLARSFGACIVTEAKSLEELRQQVKDAVCCHFDENCAPKGIRLRFVETVGEEVISG